MSLGTKFQKLYAERNGAKLLHGVYVLNPETLLKWMKKDEKLFLKFTAKVAKAARKNRKLVKTIQEGK